MLRLTDKYWFESTEDILWYYWIGHVDLVRMSTNQKACWEAPKPLARRNVFVLQNDLIDAQYVEGVGDIRVAIVWACLVTTSGIYTEQLGNSANLILGWTVSCCYMQLARTLLKNVSCRSSHTCCEFPGIAFKHQRLPAQRRCPRNLRPTSDAFHIPVLLACDPVIGSSRLTSWTATSNPSRLNQSDMLNGDTD